MHEPDILCDQSELSVIRPFAFAKNVSIREIARQLALGLSSASWHQLVFDDCGLLSPLSDYLDTPGTESRLVMLRLNQKSLEEFVSEGDFDSWKLGHLNPGAETTSEIPITIKHVDVCLIEGGRGFAVLSLSARTSKSDTWLDLMHFARFAGGQNGVFIQREMKSKSSDTETTLSKVERPAPRHKLGMLIDRLTVENLSSASVSFAASSGNARILTPLLRLAFENTSKEILKDELGRFKHCLRSGDRQISGQSWGERLLDDATLQFSDKQSATFSLNGGILLNFPAGNYKCSGFGNKALHGDPYLLTYLLALNQYQFLTSLTDDIAKVWPSAQTEASDKIFAELRHDFQLFTSTQYLSHVSASEELQRYYRSWLQKHCISELYEKVRDLVNELHAERRYRLTTRQERSNRIVQTLLALIGLLVAVVGIPISYATLESQLGAESAGNWFYGGIVVAFGILLVTLIFAYLLRKLNQSEYQPTKQQLERRS